MSEDEDLFAGTGYDKGQGARDPFRKLHLLLEGRIHEITAQAS